MNYAVLDAFFMQVDFHMKNYAYARYAVQIYFMAACLATAYGAFCGMWDWSAWMMHRRYRPIALKTVEPIVNAAADAGTMAFMVAGSAIASGAVALTAPISVPLLLATASEPIKKRD